MIAAILTLSRAWIVAGSPPPAETMASFESWAQVVGGILQVAGIEGFLKTPEDRKHFDDPQEQTEREFVAAWLYHVLKDPVVYQKAKARVLLKMAEAGDLAIGQGMRASDHGQLTLFGTRLTRMRDKTFVVSDVASLLALEPAPEVRVKVLRHGTNSDAWWKLEVMEVRVFDPKTGTATVKTPGDWQGISPTVFWTPPAI